MTDSIIALDQAGPITEVISFPNGGAVTFVMDQPSSTSAPSPTKVTDKYASYGTPSVYVVTSPTSEFYIPSTTTYDYSSRPTSLRSQDINRHQVDPSTLLASGFRSTSVTVYPVGPSGYATEVEADVGYFTSGKFLILTTIFPSYTPTTTATGPGYTATDIYASPYAEISGATASFSPSPLIVSSATYVQGSGNSNSSASLSSVSGTGNAVAKKNSSALAGVVGGMLALTIAATIGALIWWKRYRRKKRESMQAFRSNHSGASAYGGIGGEKSPRDLIVPAAPSGSTSTLDRSSSVHGFTIGLEHDAGDDEDAQLHRHGRGRGTASETSLTAEMSSRNRSLATLLTSNLDSVPETFATNSPLSAGTHSRFSPTNGRELTVGFGPNAAEPYRSTASLSSSGVSTSAQATFPSSSRSANVRRAATTIVARTTPAAKIRAVETRPDEITPYHLPPNPIPPVLPPRPAPSATLPPSRPAAHTLETPAPSSPRPRRISLGSRSVTTLNTLTTDDDVFAVDGSSLARTLTTESSNSRDTLRLGRRSSSPVAWGTISDPFADPTYTNTPAYPSEPSQSHTQFTPASDPFADTLGALPQPPRPAFLRSSNSQSSLQTTSAQTEISFRPGDDHGELSVGPRWQANRSHHAFTTSAMGSATLPPTWSQSGTAVASTSSDWVAQMRNDRVIHHLIDGDEDDDESVDLPMPPPAYEEFDTTRL